MRLIGSIRHCRWPAHWHWHQLVLRGLPAFVLLALFIVNVVVLFSSRAGRALYKEWLPSSAGSREQVVRDHAWRVSRPPSILQETQDQHPIRGLMRDADGGWERYIDGRSKTFKQTVDRYRSKYGRQPPPGFKQWYKYARERRVYNIDDFDQIRDDLRPFWALEPRELRTFASHASERLDHLLSTISVRDGQVFQKTWGSWRSKTFISMIKGFAQYLPDMDIPLNRMDQPRVIVPWQQMQAYLAKEVETRSLSADTTDAFTLNKDELFSPNVATHWWDAWLPLTSWSAPSTQREPPEDYGWYAAQGQQFMNVAAKACPPTSHAVNQTMTQGEADQLYKHPNGGFITNFNLSSDLCTAGPEIQELHGLLYASASMLITKRLVPVFGECKVNINSDILFPANMYWKRDKRYEYKDDYDVSWDDKGDAVLWRGVTSGGTQLQDNWKHMHRQRLVLLLNATEMQGSNVNILVEDTADSGDYTNYTHFQPSAFASSHTNVGFTEKMSCIPNCDFYNDTLNMLNQTTMSQQFGYKYLVDVDGHSFSGRWRAFLQSRSLGIKATIFREWHDSRLFAWRHFVPMDNRYDDLYSLLTYFIGINSNTDTQQEGFDSTNAGVKVVRHDYEAKRIADQGREWAQKVLRREDLEIYTFRLLLEYGRIIDDNRDRIGVSDDGGEEMEEFDRLHSAVE